MIHKIDDLRNIWIPRVFPRSEATDTIRTEVVATLIRRNRRFENAGLRSAPIAKVLDPYPEQTDRFLNLGSQSMLGMYDLTIPIMLKLVEFATYDVDRAIVV